MQRTLDLCHVIIYSFKQEPLQAVSLQESSVCVFSPGWIHCKADSWPVCLINETPPPKKLLLVRPVHIVWRTRARGGELSARMSHLEERKTCCTTFNLLFLRTSVLHICMLIFCSLDERNRASKHCTSSWAMVQDVMTFHSAVRCNPQRHQRR